MSEKSAVDYEGLRTLLVGCRKSRGVNLREVALETGVSASTLSRIERGHVRADLPTIQALLKWMGVPLDRVVKHKSPAAPRKRSNGLESFEVQFRADPKLSPAAAEALIKIMRTAYEEFAKTGEDPGVERKR